jgi:hypothetical protein
MGAEQQGRKESKIRGSHEMLKMMTKVRLLDGSSIVLSIDEVDIVIESRPYFTIAVALR